MRGVQAYCPCPRFLSPAPIPFCPRRGQQIRKSRTKWYTGNMCVCKYVPARNDPFWTLCKTCLPQYELNLNPVGHFMTPIRPNATHFWPTLNTIWTKLEHLWPQIDPILTQFEPSLTFYDPNQTQCDPFYGLWTLSEPSWSISDPRLTQ